MKLSLLLVFLAIASCVQSKGSGLKNKLDTATNQYCSNPTSSNLFKLQNFLNAYESQESKRDEHTVFARAILDGSVNCQENKFKKATTTDGISITCDSTPADVEFGVASLDCSFSVEVDEGIFYYYIYAYQYTSAGAYIYAYPSNNYYYDSSASSTFQSGTATFPLPQYAPSGSWYVEAYAYGPGYNYYTYANTYFYVEANINDQGPPTLVSISFPVVDTASSLTAYIPFQVQDDLSGVEEVYAFFYDSSISNYFGSASWYYSGTPQLSVSSYLQASLQNQPFGTYVVYIELYDIVGFNIELTPAQLAAAGFPSTITNAGNNCTAGHYKPAGATGACLTCPAGTYSAFGSIACTACPPGSHGNGKGATSCLQCDVGYFSNGGTAACTLCTAGHYGYSVGTAVCTPCQPGTYVDTTGATSCTGCPAGTKSCAGATTCTACAAGTYSTGYASYCTSCQAGYYTSSTGSTSCSPCPVGTYAGKVGATTCTACPAGKSSPAGSVGQVACV